MIDKFGSNHGTNESSTNSLNSNGSPLLGVDQFLTHGKIDDRTLPDGSNSDLPPISLSIAGFKIVRLLGRGGMGVVYEAVEEELNRRVALKVLPTSSLADERQIARFKAEARAVAQLHHENIVPIYKVGNDCGIYYYTMQLIKGCNLSQVIGNIKSQINSHPQGVRSDTKRRSASKTNVAHGSDGITLRPGSSRSGISRPDLTDLASVQSSGRNGANELALYRSIAQFAAEIAAALAHAHDNGVIHRDIKPSNILVDESNKPWITDFGLAIIRDASIATQPGDVVGTYRYMSPEQATGRRFLIDHRTDIYSLGVTLYELVTQSVPFPGTEPHEILRQVSFEEPISVHRANPAIPEELDIIITKAISRNPHDRYESAHDFCDDLNRFATGRQIKAKRVSLSKRVRRWISRHQGLALSASIIFLVTFVAAIVTAGTTWTAYNQANSQRVSAIEALDRSEGLRLAANSQLTRVKDPGLSLCLAVEGAKQVSSPEIHATLIGALAETFERKAIYLPGLVTESIQLSPDGKQAVCLSATSEREGSTTALLLDTASGQVVRKFGEEANFTDVRFHPSGHLVVTISAPVTQTSKQANAGSMVNPAQLRDLSKPDAKLVLLESAPLLLQNQNFSRDGRLLLLPSTGNTVSVYNGFTGDRMIVSQQHRARVIRAVVSDDGGRAASLDESGQLMIWDPAEGTLLGQIDSAISTGQQPNLNITPGGKYVVLTTSSGAYSYDISQNSPQKVAKWREPNLAICPNKLQGACYWSASNYIQVRDLATGQSISDIQLSVAPSSVAYTRDGQFLVVAVEENVVIIEPNTAKELFWLRGHTRKVHSVSIDQNFDTIVTTSSDKSVRFWASRSLLEQNSFPIASLLPIPTRDLCVSFDNKVVYATGKMSETSLVDPDSQRLLRVGSGKLIQEQPPSGLIILCDDDCVRAVDSTTIRKIAEVTFPNVKVSYAARCGDSSNVLIQLEDDSWFVWNYADQTIRRFPINRSQVTQKVMSPDDGQIALLGHDGLCSVHAIPSGNLIGLLPHQELLTAIAWSKNRGIFTLDSVGTLRQWDIETDTQAARWQADTLGANSLTVQDHSDQIVAYHGWFPQKMTCWNMETGELKQSADGWARMKLRPHPSQSLFLVASMEQGAHIWDTNDGSLFELTKNRAIAGEFIGGSIVVAEVGIEKHIHNHPAFFRSASGASSIVYFDLNTRQRTRSIPLNRKPIELVADADRQKLVVSYETWHAAIVDRKSSGVDLSPPFASSVSVIRHLGSSGNWLVASTDGTALVLDRFGKSIQSLVTEGPPILTAAVSRDFKQCALGDLQGGRRVVDMDTGLITYADSLQQHAIRQIEFVDQDTCLLSLDDEGRMARTKLADKSTQEYFPKAGVRSFSMLADGMRALVVLGVDEKIAPGAGASKNVATLQTNSKLGSAELLLVSTMTAQTVFPENILAADVDPVSARIALILSSGKLVVIEADTLKKINQWELHPWQMIAVRWIGNNRLAALSTTANMTIWNSLDGRLLAEFKSPVNTMARHMSFRDQWMPLDVTSEMLLGPGKNEIFQAYPREILEYARQNLPRDLTLEESMLYLNPLSFHSGLK